METVKSPVEPRNVPWRDPRRIQYFIKDKERGLVSLTYPEAVLAVAEHPRRKQVYAAYSDSRGDVSVIRTGPRFTAMAKRAIRSAQERAENPPCEGLTLALEPCRVISVTQWRDLNVCAMHDPEGEFCKEHPDYKVRVLAVLRGIKKAEVHRLEDRLTALLLERFGPSKGKGFIG